MCPPLPPHDGWALPDKNSFRDRLSENVRRLLVSGRSVDDDFLMFDMLTEMVERLVDMFGAWAHFRQVSEL